MKKSLRPLALSFAVIVLAAGVFMLDILRVSGSFRRFDARFRGSCMAVVLGGSSEDLAIDAERGIAYLSVLDRASLARNQAVSGTIMLLDLNLAQPAARAALAYDPPDFRPHGISILKRAGEPVRLFAISHRADGSHVVEIAEQDVNGAFVPKARVQDPALVSPNAVAAVGGRQFYVANDRRAGAGMADYLLRRATSTLVYYDGTRGRVVAEGLKFSAGLAASADGTRLYAGEALGRQMRIYRRDPATGALTLEDIVPLGTAPDNLRIDADGVVWIAAHPKMLAFAAHAGDPQKRSPTQVLRFDPRTRQVEQVYGNDGTQVSAGTVAARWRGGFLIGALMEPKVLICKTNP